MISGSVSGMEWDLGSVDESGACILSKEIE